MMSGRLVLVVMVVVIVVVEDMEGGESRRPTTSEKLGMAMSWIGRVRFEGPA